MAKLDAIALSENQRAALERLLRAGFRFMTLERVERHLAAERDGFVALLDLSGSQVQLFGQIGRAMRGGLGMLIEQQGRKVFVCHEEVVEASDDLLNRYAQFKAELCRLLGDEAQTV